MLVVISDLHITDGTSAYNVHPSAFDLLRKEIVSAAADQGAKEVHVLLLGDIFDLVRTTYWHDTIPAAERPWGGELDPATGMNLKAAAIQAQFDAVLGRVLQTPEATALLGVLNGLAKATGLPTLVTYVPGNHDRVFNNFDSLKRTVTAAFNGVSGFSFANEFRSEAYGVLARHGHEWDENCHGWNFYNKVLRPRGQPAIADRFAPEAYRVMAIGEVVTAELMSGLIYHARAADTGNWPGYSDFIAALKDLNNVRPTLAVFTWVEWFGRGRLDKYKSVLFDALKQSLDGVLNSTLARRWDDLVTDLLVQGDLTDRLSLVRKRLMGSSYDQFEGRIGAISKLADLAGRLSSDKDEYAAGAAQEKEWASWSANPPGPIQYVLYGHTHTSKHVAFEAARNQRIRMYINTGTMLPLIQRTASGNGFESSGQMTLAFAFQASEDTHTRADQGPTVRLWNGILRKQYVPPQPAG
jgi:UDP-2,3-diacylglucosamine pyrophosphatase LpxH